LFQAWAESDPLERFRGWLRAEQGFTDDEEAAMREEITRELNEAVRRAEASPLPDPAEVAHGVYADEAP
jgi:TPP-dependent pyruvate/acetoin dehydrogenase alpha subunit